MAVNIGAIGATITVNPEPWKKGLREGEGALSKFSAAVGLSLTAIAGLGAATAASVAVIDDGMDTIRLGTGALGADLAALGKDFQSVLGSVPVPAAEAATAIADLNTRTGQTGPALQALSAQVLNLSRLTGDQLSPLIASTTRVFGDWDIATEKQAETLDLLWKTSQATGIGVSALSERVVQFGAPLRQMGFDLAASATLLGKWEKEGVNTELVLGGMRKALAGYAKAGKSAEEGLRATIARITELGPGAKATGLAMEVFGAKAGPDMAAAITEGRFAFDDLLRSIRESPETIRAAADDTDGLAESLALMRNNATLALNSIAGPLLPTAEAFMRNVASAAQSMGQRIAEMDPTLRTFAAGMTGVTIASPLLLVSIASMVRSIRTLKVAMAGLSFTPLGVAVLAIGAVALVAYRFRTQIADAFGGAWKAVASFASGAAAALVPAVAAVTDFATKVAAVVALIVFGTIGGLYKAWQAVWGAVGPAVSAAAAMVELGVRSMIEAVTGFVRETVATMRAWATAFVDFFAGAWDAVVLIVRNNAFLNAIVNAIGGVVDWLADKVSDFIAAGRELVVGLVRGILGWIRNVPGLGPRVADFIENAFGGERAVAAAARSGRDAAKAYTQAATATAANAAPGVPTLPSATGGAKTGAAGSKTTWIEQATQQARTLQTIWEHITERGQDATAVGDALGRVYLEAESRLAAMGNELTKERAELLEFVKDLRGISGFGFTVRTDVRGPTAGSRQALTGANPLLAAQAQAEYWRVEADRQAARMEASIAEANQIKRLAREVIPNIVRDMLASLPGGAAFAEGYNKQKEVSGHGVAAAAAGVHTALAMEFLAGAANALGPALAGLLLPVRLIGEMIGTMLVPVVRLLFGPLKALALIVTYVQTALGWFVRGIGKLIDKIPGLSGGPIIRAGQSIMDGADDMRKKLHAMSFDDAVKEAENGAKAINRSMVNMVEGFKVASHRFAAVSPHATAGAVRANGGAAAAGTVFTGSVDASVTIMASPGDDGGDLYRKWWAVVQAKARANPQARAFAAMLPVPA